MPSTVVVPGAIQHHGNEHFDVEDSKGLGVDGGVLGLVGVEGRGTIRGSLAGSLGLTSGDLRGLALALEAEGALSVGLTHDERRHSGVGVRDHDRGPVREINSATAHGSEQRHVLPSSQNKCTSRIVVKISMLVRNYIYTPIKM